VSANASPAIITGASSNLGVVASDVTAGEAALIYTWATTGLAPGAVVFSNNGTNAAKNTMATFSQAGTYNFQVTIDNPTIGSAFATTSSVTVVVNQTLTSIAVSPGTSTLTSGQTQQFAAIGLDQFGGPLVAQPGFSWGLSSGSVGNVSASGLFSAPESPVG